MTKTVKAFGYVIPLSTPTVREFMYVEKAVKDDALNDIALTVFLINNRVKPEVAVTEDALLDQPFTEQDEEAMAALVEPFLARIVQRTKRAVKQLEAME